MPETFRLFDLPVELQLHVMKWSPVLTYDLIHACEQAKQVYMANSSTILVSFLQQWPQQLRNLIQTFLAIRQGVLTSLETVNRSLHGTIDIRKNKEPSNTHESMPGTLPPLETLRILRIILLDLEMCTDIFVKNTLTKAAEMFKAPPVVSVPPFSQLLTPTELYRIQRAFFRCILFAEIDRQRIKKLKSGTLQKDLATWEVEELVTISHLFRDLLRPVHSFPKSYPYLSRNMASGDTFVFGALSPSNVDVDMTFLKNGSEPLRTWDGVGGANRESYGLVYARREIAVPNNNHNARMQGANVRRRLRGYGFFVWDESRISRWNELPNSSLVGSEDLAYWGRMERYINSSHEDIGEGLADYRDMLANYLQQRN